MTLLHDTEPVVPESPDSFRARLRGWLASHVEGLDTAEITASHRQRLTAGLYDEGLLGMTWPREYGGRGLPAEFQTIWNDECAPYAWAFVFSAVTVGICAATLLDCGSEEQKREHIARMLRGDEAWTQLLSEPGAGSDLASVQLSAARNGGAYALNGQKVWTSGAAECDFAVALVRTDATAVRRRGLSMLIVDLRAPGIEIRPLREMTGDALFNEVFFDDVAVPVESLLGKENEGWRVLLQMLTHERIALSAGTAGMRLDEDVFPRLWRKAAERDVLHDPLIREAIVEVYMQQRLLDLTGARIREALVIGKDVGPIGSIGKIGMARVARAAAETTALIMGAATAAWLPTDVSTKASVHALLRFPMTGIAGGTTEIQKNIVAERVLGLPRDPRGT